MDWAGEKVLVFGGSGFLGANIVHCLVTERGVRPEDIRALSNRATHALDDLPGVDQTEGTILDRAVVVRACEGRTIVFHAAGSATFDPRLKRQQWLANVEGTRNVLDAVRASRTHALEVVSVLPGTCFGGYGETGDAARLIAAVMRGAIPAAPRGGLPLAHVDDVARGHVLAVERGRPGAMYIVSGKPEDNRRHADMMAIIAEVVGIKARFPVLPTGLVWLAAAASEARAVILRQPAALSRQAALASRYALFYSSERAEKELGYMPQRTFREAVPLMYHSLKCGGTP